MKNMIKVIILGIVIGLVIPTQGFSIIRPIEKSAYNESFSREEKYYKNLVAIKLKEDASIQSKKQGEQDVVSVRNSRRKNIEGHLKRHEIKYKKIKKMFAQDLSDRNWGNRLRKKQIFSQVKEENINKIRNGLDRWFTVELEEGQNPREYLMSLRLDSNIESVSLVPRIEPLATPNDELFSYQWSLHNTGQGFPGFIYNQETGLWMQTTIKGTPDSDTDFPEAMAYLAAYPPVEDVVVAVIDSGVDYTHPDLAGNMWVNEDEIPNNGVDDDGNGFVDDYNGYDFGYLDSDPMDDDDSYVSHGTHVAGTIAALTDNATGIAGLSTGSVKIMALKVFGTNENSFLDAFVYAVDNGARVLQNSWGTIFGLEYEPMKEVLQLAYENGCVTVFAAGNDATTALSYPSAYEYALSVIATDSDDRMAWYSNHGDWTDIAAPGDNILSLKSSAVDLSEDPGVINYDYMLHSGTSMAAPHVSALAALVWSVHPDYTNDQVIQALKISADDLLDANGDGMIDSGWDIYSGAGRINAYQALQGLDAGDPLAVRLFDPVEIGALYVPSPAAPPLSIAGLIQGNNINEYHLSVESTFGTEEIWDNIATEYNPETGAITGTLDMSAYDSGVHNLRLVASDIEGRHYEERFPVSVIRMPGQFPLVYGPLWSLTTVADIDEADNGQMEIINVGSLKLYVWDSEGNERLAIPITGSNSNSIPGTAAVGNVDNDVPGKEIVFLDRDGLMHLVYSDGTMDPSGWPVMVSNQRYTNPYYPPRLVDVDLDGEDEIAQLAGGGVRVFEKDGTATKMYFGSDAPTIAFSFGQLDDDPYPELVVVGGDIDFYAADYAWCEAYDHDGTVLWKQEYINTGYNLSSPVLADLDNDKRDEILFILGGNEASGKKGLQALESNGEELFFKSFPVNLYMYGSQVSVGDLEHDGDLEIIAIGQQVWAFDHEGNALGGNWPLDYSYIHGSVVMGDLDGDESQELVFVDIDNLLYVYEHDGTKVKGFPIDIGGWVSEDIPNLADLDQDGDLEIVVHAAKGVTDSVVYVFDYPKNKDGVETPRIEWGAYLGNHQRNSQYIPEIFPSPVIAPVVDRQYIWGADLVALYIRATDPSGFDLQYSAALADGRDVGTLGASFATVVLGDLDDDGDMDGADLAVFNAAMNSQPGDANFNPLCDVNNDGRVDAADLQISAPNMGTVNFTGIKAGLFTWPADRQSYGNYSLVFTVSNDHYKGDSQEAVNLLMRYDTQDPQLDPVEDATVQEGQELTLALSAVDPDGDPVSYEVGYWDAAAGAWVPVEAIGMAFKDHGDGTGTLTWTPSFEQAGTYLIHVQVSDDKFGTDAQDITITVTEDLGYAFWADLVNAGVDAEGSLTLVKLGSASAWDAGAVSAQRLEGDGVFEFRVPDLADDNLRVGLSSVDQGLDPNTIEYGLHFQESFNRNHFRVYENGVARDINNNTMVYYSAEDVFAIERRDGRISYKRNGVVFYESGISSGAPLMADAAIYSPNSSVHSPRMVPYTYQFGNHAPRLELIGNTQAVKDQRKVIQIAATDEDGDALTFTAAYYVHDPEAYDAEALPLSAIGASLYDHQDGTAALVWTPAADDMFKSFVIKVVVKDAVGARDEEIFRILVSEDETYFVNLAPVGDKTVAPGQTLTFNLDAEFNLGEGGVPQFMALWLEEGRIAGDVSIVGASFTFEETAPGHLSGTFSWTATMDFQGRDNEIMFVVQDPNGFFFMDSETITISVPGQPPLINAVDDLVVKVNELVTFRVGAEDPDPYGRVALSARLSDGRYVESIGASFVIDDSSLYGAMTEGVFTWTPTEGQVGSHGIVFTATDPQGAVEDVVVIEVVNTCGDGQCQADEGFARCEMDCPSPNCGDGICSVCNGPDPAYPCDPGYVENGLTCQPDCAATCGDGQCQADEGFARCEMDCPSPNCGDGICSVCNGPDPAYPCDPGYVENGLTCQPDCAATCGDGQCQADEGFARCEMDCPSPNCGDGICSVCNGPDPAYPCDPGYVENGLTCQPDCAATCGDGQCQADEGFARCEMDCPSPNCGDGICSVCNGPDPAYPCDPGYVENGLTCQPDCAATCGGRPVPGG